MGEAVTLMESVSRRTLLIGRLGAAFPLSGAVAAPDPGGFIHQVWREQAAYMDSGMVAGQRLAGIRNLLRSSFDVTAITDFVLGSYKRVATPQQLRDFAALYQEYTVQTYSRQLSHLAGSQLVLQNVRPSG